jgi:two-component system, NarL family, sensor histidine kinase DesK
MGVTIMLVSLAMFAFFGLFEANRELMAARSEVARLAAEGERNRIARDLHDLLGHSLTTITIKAGLARRLSASDPARAAAEIGEVEDIAQRSLSDVRAAVSGYREVSLAGELASAGEVLRAAGISASLPPSVEHVDEERQALFGWVVREGVTNVVRHARAQTCTITVGPDWVEVADDGRSAAAAPGNCPSGLGERVAAAGGRVLAGPWARDAAAGWRLRVELAGAP